MTAEEIKKKDSEYIMHTYGRFDIVLDHGKGATLWDADGKQYVDLTSGIGVNSLGHGNPAIVNAVTKQAEKLMHASNLYYTEPMVSAAEKLVTATGMGKIFFANSGAEANEGAIKLARKYSFDKYGEGRNTIVTLIQSFHGRTVTTLKATGQEKFHQYFFPFTEGFAYAKANDLADVTAKADKTCCAVMMEMIQGEGGVLPLNKEFVQGVAKFCKENDILLIVDEVQTGIGRCGSLFAYEQNCSGYRDHGERSRRRSAYRRRAGCEVLRGCYGTGNPRIHLRRESSERGICECGPRHGDEAGILKRG